MNHLLDDWGQPSVDEELGKMIAREWVQDSAPTLPPLWPRHQDWNDKTCRTDPEGSMSKLRAWLRAGAISHVLFNLDVPGGRVAFKLYAHGLPWSRINFQAKDGQQYL